MKNLLKILMLAAISAAFFSACRPDPFKTNAEAAIRDNFPGMDIKVLRFDVCSNETLSGQLQDRIDYYSTQLTSDSLTILSLNASLSAIGFKAAKGREGEEQITKAAEISDRIEQARQSYSKNYEILSYLKSVPESKDQAILAAVTYITLYRCGKGNDSFIGEFATRHTYDGNVIAYKDMMSPWVLLDDWYQIPGFKERPDQETLDRPVEPRNQAKNIDAGLSAE